MDKNTLDNAPLIEKAKKLLSDYDGRDLTIMEVCGSHTAAIAKHGIRSLLSSKIRLISGPGCPVCVTASAYIDRLIELSSKNTIVTFGDLIRVPGSKESLGQAGSGESRVVMVYSPMDVLEMAEKNPVKSFIFAAVGFETTAPVYTILLDEIIKRGIKNLKLLSALKTMPPVIEALLLDEDSRIDAFIAPGHVAAVTGSDYFKPLAERYNVPFGVSGFKAEELILAIAGIVNQIERSPASVENYYPDAVTGAGNKIAMQQLQKYFEPCDAVWRGIGNIKDSGLILRKEYARYDAGSRDLMEDVHNPACRCGEVLTGRLTSTECPLFKRTCTPSSPQGACMVSFEGSCYQNFINS